MMGCEKGSSLPTKKSVVITVSLKFKQVYGESLKDAWVRINKINSLNLNACGKEKITPLLLSWFGALV
jgi:hypothetical protein